MMGAAWEGKMGQWVEGTLEAKKISEKNPIMKQADQETKTCGGFEVTSISCVLHHHYWRVKNISDLISSKTKNGGKE
jgi:hypothetical protein